MAGQDVCGGSPVIHEEKEEDSSNMTLISFLTSQETADTWKQLKQDRSLGDSQLAVFLLRCYEDKVFPPICPRCQSALEEFCPSCFSVVNNRQDEHNLVSTTTVTQHTEGQEKDPDPTETGHSFTEKPLSPRVYKEEPSLSPVKVEHTSQPGISNGTYGSVSSGDIRKQECVKNDLEVEDDQSFSVAADQSDWRTEDNEDLSDDSLNECNEGVYSSMTEDVNTTDEIEEMRLDTRGEKFETTVNSLEMENQMAFENERIQFGSDDEGAAYVLDDVGDVDINNKVDSNVKTETQTMDRTDNSANCTSKTSKPPAPDIVSCITSKTSKPPAPYIVSCIWCDVSFSSIVALTKHLLVHTTVTWQHKHLRQALHKTANSQQRLENTDRGSKVKIKTRSGGTAQSKKNVEEGTERDFEDSIEKDVEKDVEEESQSTSEGKVFKCVQCGIEWKTPVGLTFHLMTIHIKKNAYSCLKCGKTFKSLRTIGYHMRMHPVKIVRERDPVTHPHQCGQCGRRFMHAGGLANHMERHTGPSQFWCSRCQCNFQSMLALTGHHCHPAGPHSQASYPSQCLASSRVSVHDTDQESMEEQRSAMPDTFMTPYSPSDMLLETQGQMKGEDSVSLTVEDKLNEKPRKKGRKKKRRQTTDEIKRPYKCSECPASFMHASVLKLHSQKHSGQKAFPCSQCDQSFSSKAGLFRHQEKDHWGSSPIICQDCGKSFTTARNLDEHRSLHTGERPYVCQNCGEAFPYRQALTRHRRSHRPSYFKCQDCGAEFYLKNQFKHHVNEHKAIRPHLCSHCGQAFSSISMMKQHAVRHGQKQFVCELCGKAFHKKGDHKMHMRTHMAVKPFPCALCDRSFVKRSKLKAHHSQVHLREKPHQCQQCDAAFSSATYLKDHVRFAHTTERPFPCRLCFSRFAAKRFLSLHLKRTHKLETTSSTSDQSKSTDVHEQSSAMHVLS